MERRKTARTQGAHLAVGEKPQRKTTRTLQEKTLAQLEEAEKCLLDGWPEHAVVRRLRERWPDLKDRTKIRERIIFKVLDQWAQAGSGKGREDHRNLMRARLEYGWRRSMSAGEYAAAVNFQKAIAKLDDLNNEGRAIEVTVDVKDRSALERRLKELASRGPEYAAQLRLPESVHEVIAVGLPHEQPDAGRAEGAAGAGAGLRDAEAAVVHPDDLEDVR